MYACRFCHNVRTTNRAEEKITSKDIQTFKDDSQFNKKFVTAPVNLLCSSKSTQTAVCLPSVAVAARRLVRAESDILIT